ncbi:MAG: hypothetical protein OZ921_10260 [Sorangiineae bacterium]|nr:hypothetical protein [Polyangiaceae bacterium]MEB2322889.1 hypothetical protein [Sorangiineae bacterium]
MTAKRARASAESSAPTSEVTRAAPGKLDAVIVHGRTDDGKGLRVLRLREDRVETGAVLPLEDGKPIQGEVVRLRPRAELPLVCDVESVLPAPAAAREVPAAAARKGPAQVSSDRYRANWDAIWPQSKRRVLAN